MNYVPVDVNEAVRKEGFRRRFSQRTIETYQECIQKFLKFSGKSVDRISKKDVLDFLGYLSEQRYAGSSMHVYQMSIRFLLEDILHKNIHLNIRYSKRPERLPTVLTKDEVKNLFDAIGNEKHKLMIQMMYSAGLRVSELINLKVKDLEIDKNYGFVRQGKGNKDRLFIIAESLKYRIVELIEKEKLNGDSFLFTTNRGERYSVRSLQIIVKDASKLAGLDYREIHCHTLRHSFATHLIEQGQTVSEVQSLLGHKSPETTMIYLHTATSKMLNIKSPLDNF